MQENKYIPKCNWYTAYTTKTCIKWWELQIKSKDPGNQRSGMFVPPMKAPIMAMTSWNQEYWCILDTQMYFLYFTISITYLNDSGCPPPTSMYLKAIQATRTKNGAKKLKNEFFSVIYLIIEAWKLSVDNHSRAQPCKNDVTSIQTKTINILAFQSCTDLGSQIRNTHNQKVEISFFFYHSDFTWNQIRRNKKFWKSCFAIFGALNLVNLVSFSHLKVQKILKIKIVSL